MRTRTGVAAGAVALAGAVGLGLLVAPGGAGAAPELPPVTPEELVASVLAAEPDAYRGTVELENNLGLPAVGALPQAADGRSTARIWSDGESGGRVSLPTDTGERTIVADGATVWAWNSEDRTAVRAPRGEAAPHGELTDPTAAATEALEALRATSTVTVDGTAEVAGRPAYELVLAPAPTERTLLREVRIAVDAQRRVPLQLTVLSNGSTDPALRVRYTDLDIGDQDPELFTFTPPPGATVQERAPTGGGWVAYTPPAVVGDGWDAVVVGDAGVIGDTGPPGDGAELPAELGTPVSGPWGSGRLVTTAVASAILTDDGRVAAGAVPEQVLTEALAR